MRERDLRRLGGQGPQQRHERRRILRRQPPLPARRQRSRPEPEEASPLRREPLGQPLRRALDPPVLLEPPRELLGRLLRAPDPRAPPRPGTARAPSARAARRPARGTRRTRRDRALPARRAARRTRARSPPRRPRPRQLLPQDQRQEQVERALERVEVELELADAHARGTLAARVGRGHVGWPSSARGRLALLRPPLRHDSNFPRKNCHQMKNAVEQHEHDQRHPRVQPQPAIGATDRSAAAPRRSARTCRTTRRARTAPGGDAAAPVDEEQHADHRQVVDELVEEGRVEGRVVLVPRHAVVDVDLEPPRQVGRLAVQLLVQPVAPAADRPARAAGRAPRRPNMRARSRPSGGRRARRRRSRGRCRPRRRGRPSRPRRCPSTSDRAPRSSS